MKQIGFQGKWVAGKNSINVNVSLMLFKEDDVHIAYIPALDISGYGNTEEESKKSLEISLAEYFSYATNKNTLVDDLKSHGWIIKKKSKPFIAPEITDIIKKNGYLHDIVNTLPYKMDRMDLPMPQYA